jgi:levanase/fructan beta-fructosidase
MIGWMNNWQYGALTPTGGWRGAMTLVREVTLIRQSGQVVLKQQPVDPFAGTGDVVCALAPTRLSGSYPLAVDGPADVLRIDAEFVPGTADEVGLVLREGTGERTVLAYNGAQGVLRLDRTASGETRFHEDFASVERVPVELENGRLRLQVFLDRCSVEVFAQDGLATITDQIFPSETSTSLSAFANGEGATLVGLAVVR